MRIYFNATSTLHEASIKGPDDRCQSNPSLRKILPIPVHLVHPLVPDRDDADVPFRQTPPVHEMMRVPEVEALQTDPGRDGAWRDAVAFDLVERREALGDTSIRLLRAPAGAPVAVDLVKPQGFNSGRGNSDP